MATCFVGQMPALHAEMEMKFRKPQAMLKAETKNAVFTLQILFSNRSSIMIADKIMCNSPGFPKLMASAFIPVTIIFCDSIETQGKKQLKISKPSVAIDSHLIICM